MKHFIVHWLVIAACFAGSVRAEEPVDYLAQVKPILAERCFACHGALKQEAGLRLDTGALIRKGGQSGAVVAPGKVDESLLIERISETDELLRMPPEGQPLTAGQIDLVKAWILQGAKSPADEQPQQDPREHWAFRVPVRPPAPQVANSGWVRNPIDAFIAADHERHGLTPRPPASKEVLLRRVYFDLIGLPPTRQEVDAFLADDSPQAYDKVVDRLLDSPHYGERWGRHWMDVWRYSDWYGRRAANDVRNSSSQIWRWRDWIVNSINGDKGYDRMILEMLAGDEIAPDDPQVVVATGFIVRNCYRLNFHTWKQDMVEHTAKAFLGLTFNCAHCHDHKYDPISQENYFQLRAFFEPLMMRHDRLPGLPDPGPMTEYDFHSNGDKPIEAGLARVFDGVPDAPTRVYRRGDPRNIVEEKPPVSPGLPAFLQGDGLSIEPIDLPAVAYFPGAKDYIRSDERRPRQEALASAETAYKKAQLEHRQRLESLQTAINVADAERRAAEAEFSQAPTTPASSAGSPASEVSGQLLAEWRFEGDEEVGVLSDSSGNGLTLLRSTGNDERVDAFPLPLSGNGSGFFRPLPHNGAANRQGLVFNQRGGQSYLYTVAGPKLHADEFTLEMCVQIDASGTPQRGTLVDYEGVWAFEHHGLNSSTSELRLRLTGADGKPVEISSNTGETPLTLAAGHDYYVAVVLNKQQTEFFAKNLTVAGELQSVQIARAPETAQLAQPAERSSFNIGRSSQGQRHRGRLDEVRLTRGSLSPDNVAARSTISPHQQRLAQAEQALAAARENLKLAHLNHTVLELQFEDAQAQLAALDARITADSARHVDKTPDAETKAVAANRAERTAALSAAKLKLAEAMHAVAAAKLALWSDPKRGAEITRAEQQMQQAREEVTAAIQKSLEPPSAQYTTLTQVFPEQSTGRRTTLARWLTDRNNPLTARVAVNHIWLRHFGRAFVESVYDFGLNGKQPTHPQLLDWLAVELMENGWKMKHLHRLIVTSSAYRMQSKTDDQDRQNIAADPENRRLWHFNERRMEAEIVRDSILASSGQLDRALGGQDIDTKFEVTIPRRSMYFTIHPEGGRLEFTSVFDPPDPTDCYRRAESVIPQQALAMTNSRMMLNQSRLLARKLWKEIELQTPEEGARESAFISSLFVQTLSRYPTTDEETACLEFLHAQVQLFQQSGPLPEQTSNGDVAPSADPRMRARESLAGAVFSHNDFVTIR